MISAYTVLTVLDCHLIVGCEVVVSWVGVTDSLLEWDELSTVVVSTSNLFGVLFLTIYTHMCRHASFLCVYDCACCVCHLFQCTARSSETVPSCASKCHATEVF